ncbi:MAG: C45 family autoproteolytic acyltransferase/hydrolase [Alphaproteobacteria bacterium]|jgi:isopenicillin-N N-acyltransferase-like protein|nr:C45 family autoproteolytic acyltransferase/hydrolase [Alphaproteobacteria bacterium]MDP6516296.1 C45 family autoproteolytic acyltransferase/hydrolase [Alphaproteobacteria bacterium]
MTGLPLLDLTGTAHERGLHHGRALATQIRDNIETYLRRFAAGGLDRDTVLAEGELWAPRIARFSARYAEEMAGVAEGAGLAIGPVAMLNARYELAYSLFAREARAPDLAEGCTAFGALPERVRGGTTLIGQNWDWLARIRGRLAVLRVRPAEDPAYLCLTQAGIVGGMIGLNETGLGLCVNGLTTDQDGVDTEAKPFHVRVYEILRATTFAQALTVILGSDRVCSTNFLLGHADGEIIDIEAAPRRANTLQPTAGLLTHGNHFETTDGFESTMEKLFPSTLYRVPRLARLLRRHDGTLDLQVIQGALTDHFSHPFAICRHEDPDAPEDMRTITVTSVILALADRTLYATDGPPCQNPYHTYTLDPH